MDSEKLFWMALADWAKLKGITISRAAQLARDNRIRVGNAIAARKVSKVWVIRSDADYTRKPKGPPKGKRHSLKRKRASGRHWTSGPDNGLPFWQ